MRIQNVDFTDKGIDLYGFRREEQKIRFLSLSAAYIPQLFLDTHIA